MYMGTALLPWALGSNVKCTNLFITTGQRRSCLWLDGGWEGKASAQWVGVTARARLLSRKSLHYT